MTLDPPLTAVRQVAGGSPVGDRVPKREPAGRIYSRICGGAHAERRSSPGSCMAGEGCNGHLRLPRPAPGERLIRPADTYSRSLGPPTERRPRAVTSSDLPGEARGFSFKNRTAPVATGAVGGAQAPGAGRAGDLITSRELKAGAISPDCPCSVGSIRPGKAATLYSRASLSDCQVHQDARDYRVQSFPGHSIVLLAEQNGRSNRCRAEEIFTPS